MKEWLIRMGCLLLGILLTVCFLLIYQKKQNGTENEITKSAQMKEVVEPEIEVVKKAEHTDYEEEAEEKFKELNKVGGANEDTPGVKEVATISDNSVDGPKLKWIKDYPTLNSTALLEQRITERSSYDETLAVNAFDKKVIENSTIDFSNVKITILGDSITEGSNLSEEERKKYAYPVILKEILGCKELLNMGIGGSTISTAANNYPMVNRWHDIPLDSDIIIVFGGSNDCLFENKWQYGHLEYENRMNEDTFCGDLDSMVSGMQYTYREQNQDKYRKLIFINPPSTILNDGVYSIDPGNMIKQEEFAKAINEIAPNYGFEVIDFYNNNILNTHDQDVNAEFMPDGIHGNEEGYRIIAEHIASQIIQRIQQ